MNSKEERADTPRKSPRPPHEGIRFKLQNKSLLHPLEKGGQTATDNNHTDEATNITPKAGNTQEWEHGQEQLGKGPEPITKSMGRDSKNAATEESAANSADTRMRERVREIYR